MYVTIRTMQMLSIVGVSMRFIHNLFSVHLGYTCNDRLGFCLMHEQWSCAFFWLLVRLNGCTELRMRRLIYTKRYASILLHHSIPPFHSTIPFQHSSPPFHSRPPDISLIYANTHQPKCPY